MNVEIEEKIHELIWRAKQMRESPEAVALVQEAVQLADSHNDDTLGFRGRMALMDITAFSGDSDKLLVAFTWCLGYADRQSENRTDRRFSQHELLWKYKWVVDKLVHFPGIPKERMFSALEDFRTRAIKAGFNERSTLRLRWGIELATGNLEAAKAAHQKWKLTRRDGMTDCEACEINGGVELLAACGEHEAAIKAAGPILSGKKRCGEIPHLTFAGLLKSFWLVRGSEEAEQFHARGYPLVRGNKEFIRQQARHIDHLLRAGKNDQALTLVRRHLPVALESPNADDRFFLLVAARDVIRRMSDDGMKSFRLRVPEKHFPAAGKTSVKSGPFLAWLDESIAELAGQFDRRNGNDWFGKIGAGKVEAP